MKKLASIWLVFLGFMLFIAGPQSRALAAEVSYSITQQDVTAEISAEGNVKFTQKWVFDVTHMNGALLKVDTGGFNLSQYRVGVEVADGQVDYFTEAMTGARRTFEVQSSRDIKTFKAYFPVDNQKVTFVAEYTLDRIVTNYADTAEFNRKLIGEGVDFTTDVTAKVILPLGEMADPDSFKAWGHGGTGAGTVTLDQENGRHTVTLEVKGNPANRFVEVRTIFPIALTPLNTNRVAENKKAEIEEAETAQAAADKKAYDNNQLLNSVLQWGSILLMSWLPIRIWCRYFRLRKELNPNPIKLPEHNYQLPSETAPAVIAAAIFRSNGEPNPNDFSATVADLARKGYLELEEVRREKRGFFGNQAMTVRVTKKAETVEGYPLQGHEQAVLDFLIPLQETTVTLEDLEKRMQKNIHFARKRQKNYEHFQNRASIAGSKLVVTARDQNRSLMAQAVVAIILNILLGAVAFVVGALNAYNSLLLYVGIGGLFLAIFQIVTTIVFFIVLYRRTLRTAAEDQLYQEWHGFAKMLEDVGQMNMRDIASLALWEEYLVYAISFGIADKVLDALKIQFTQTELMEGMVYYPTYYNTGLYSHVLTQAVTSNIQSAAGYSVDRSYSGSNSGGFGGGFSGGSSGGSGGGGGASGF